MKLRDAALGALLGMVSVCGWACGDDEATPDAGALQDTGTADAQPGTDTGRTDTGTGDTSTGDTSTGDTSTGDTGSADGGDGGSSDVPLEELPSAGYVEINLQYGPGYDARYGSASFYSNYTIEGTPELPQPPLTGRRTEDECEPIDLTGSVTGTVTYTYLDVGPQLAVMAGADTHVYERSIEGEVVRYDFQGFPFERPWEGGPISVDIPGSSTVAGAVYSNVFTPGATRFDLVGTSTVITSSVGSNIPIEFSWTPDTESTEVYLFVLDLAGQDPFPICTCQVVDDGSFTLPGECVDSTSGDNGLIVVANQSYFQDVAFNGRRLRLEANVAAQINIARVVE